MTNTTNSFKGKKKPTKSYYCVKCQEWHYNDNKIYNQHRKYKHDL